MRSPRKPVHPRNTEGSRSISPRSPDATPGTQSDTRSLPLRTENSPRIAHAAATHERLAHLSETRPRKRPRLPRCTSSARPSTGSRLTSVRGRP
jgi:hypothetical protein